MQVVLPGYSVRLFCSVQAKPLCRYREGGVSWCGGYVGELRLMNVSM